MPRPLVDCLSVFGQYVFHILDAIVHNIVQELLVPTLLCLFHPLVIVKSVHHPLCHVHFEFADALFRISNIA
jgi:hypothetical protein